MKGSLLLELIRRVELLLNEFLVTHINMYNIRGNTLDIHRYYWP